MTNIVVTNLFYYVLNLQQKNAIIFLGHSVHFRIKDTLHTYA